ncbi:hypothetical protein NliqN6_2497 [Naganishia liquefaciens]|uniref:L-type lectin-like domain-containing protein n=1 Tax=Naganishia liquefaciens TaxID=104408 RepID=A0A8H3YE27_9TREE|nr:hypothetical protein NliqN6_2497 [Naganishia liquefaciens]
MKWYKSLLSSLPLLLAIPSIVAKEEVEDTVSSHVERLVPLRTHTLYAPYVDQDLQNRWWDFGGDAIINTNKHIRLTQDRQSEVGWLWSRMPIRVTNYQVEVEFKINGKGHSLFGDGLALWLTKDRVQPGPVFGSVDYFTGLAVFMDTYANSRHSYSFPRVTAMMGDGRTAYDHDHDNEKTELAACSVDVRRREIGTKLRLTYLGELKKLQLKLQTDKWEEWKVCFEVSDFELPAGEIYLGFSAATGDVSDAHDIISVSTNQIYTNRTYGAPPANVAQAHKSQSFKARSGSGFASWFLFFLKATGLVFFCVFAFSAWRTYNAQKNGKRF